MGALAELAPRLYKYFRFRGLDIDEANDLTSAVFARAFERSASYQPSRGALAPWLFAIARNMLNNHWRAAQSHVTLPLEAAEQRPGLIVRGETRRELLAALASLDERERDLIALKFSAHLTNRAIARLMGLSQSNVGVVLFRAMRKLRAALTRTAGGTS
jgi:RNA polymerase sigma factor (sigma-70 family)